jgi:hypothetical protein
MASISRKTSSGYKEIANTAGVLFPQDIRFCDCSYNSNGATLTSIASAPTAIPFEYAANPGSEDWTELTGIIDVPESGTYQINFTVVFSGGPVGRQVGIIRKNGVLQDFTAVSQDRVTATEWVDLNKSVIMSLQQDDRLALDFYAQGNIDTTCYAASIQIAMIKQSIPEIIYSGRGMVSSDNSGLGHINQDGTFNINGLEGPFVRTVDGVHAEHDSNIPLFVKMTRDEYHSYEDPPGSGMYPALVGKTVTITDVYPENGAPMSMPDGMNMGTQNLWPQFTTSTINNGHTLHGEYIASRTGYYYIGAYIKSTPDNANVYMHLSVNNGAVFMDGMEVSGSPWRFYKRTIQAEEGDIISLNVSSDSGTPEWQAQQCNYIPAKFVYIPDPTIVIEPGSDYSLTEHPVLINDNGIIRQKKDLDGRGIWQRTFEGTITGPADNGIATQLSVPGFYNLVNSWGWVNRGDGYKFTPGLFPSEDVKFTVVFNTGLDVTVWSSSGYERNNSSYRFTLQYTKV